MESSFLLPDAVVVAENARTGCRIVERGSCIWKVYETAVIINRKQYKNRGTCMKVSTLHDDVLREVSILKVLLIAIASHHLILGAESPQLHPTSEPI